MKQTMYLILLICIGSTAVAQMSSDPHHEVYRYFEEWETRGYINQVPPIRPFPGQVVESLLRQVLASGDAHAAEQARRFLRPYDSDRIMNWTVTGEHTSTYQAGGAYGWNLGVGAGIEGRFHPLVYYSADLRIVLSNKAAPLLTPLLERSRDDTVQDNFGFSAGGADFNTLWQLKSSASIGNSAAYLQTGVMRRSFGPFHDDSPIISANSAYTGNLLVHWRGKIASYTGGLFIMEAPVYFKHSPGNNKTDLYTLRRISVLDDGKSETNGIYDSVGEAFYRQYLVSGRRTAPLKYMFLQMISFYITPWMEFAAFETTLFGPHFDFRYLVPFKILIHLQNLGTYPDNTLIGIYLDTRVGRSWKISTLLYIDDFGANDFIRFQWNTMKAKLAFQVGAKWTPSKSPISYLSLDYLLVTPYMYAHWDNKGSYIAEPNYSNYLNGFDPIGAKLDPNSDRLTLRAQFRFGKGFELDLLGRFSQHGNASEGYLTKTEISGTVWDSGYTAAIDAGKTDQVFNIYDPEQGPQPTFQKRISFLEQSIIQRVIQFGATLRYTVYTVKKSNIFTELGYTGEYVFNRDLIKGNNAFRSFIFLGVRYSFLP